MSLGGDVTFTFSPSAGLKETTEQLVKKKLEGRDKLTPWEDFLEKKKDRKKQKKKSSQRKQVSRGGRAATRRRGGRVHGLVLLRTARS